MSIDEIRRQLLGCELLSEEELGTELEALRSSKAGGGELSSDAILDWLVERRRITEFQREAIEAGHAMPFQLGPYMVLEPVAAHLLGGMFRAVHEEFDQPVTLKVFPNSSLGDSDVEARIGREIRIFGQLDHANLPRCFDVGRVGGTHYMALEELRGEPLALRLERQERLAYPEACKLVRDVARGIAHLHENDILHRDLRPQTIWLGDADHPKVIEFSAASDSFAEVDVLEEGGMLLSDLEIIGGYEYKAPEHALDPSAADERSDIYALGCILFHCLAGRPPFMNENPVRVALQHAMVDPPDVSEFAANTPTPISETIRSMIEKDPAKRFQQAKDVAYALDQYAPAEDTSAAQPGVVEVSQQYLDWVKSSGEDKQVSDDAVGITPELTGFIDFMSRRKVRRRKRTL